MCKLCPFFVCLHECVWACVCALGSSAARVWCQWQGPQPRAPDRYQQPRQCQGEGGASWGERMGEIPFKVGVMTQPRKASQQFVSALLITSPPSAGQMGGYATSITHSKSGRVWISPLPIRWLSLNVLWKSLISVVTFHQAMERPGARAVFEKAYRSPLFLAHFITKVQVVLVYSSETM